MWQIDAWWVGWRAGGLCVCMVQTLPMMAGALVGVLGCDVEFSSNRILYFVKLSHSQLNFRFHLKKIQIFPQTLVSGTTDIHKVAYFTTNQM